MRKKIGAMLCFCLLTGLVSGCGSEESRLTEDSSAAAFVGSSEPETAGRTDSGNDRPLVTESSQFDRIGMAKFGMYSFR